MESEKKYEEMKKNLNTELRKYKREVHESNYIKAAYYEESHPSLCLNFFSL